MRAAKRVSRARVRKHLSADPMIQSIRGVLEKVPDPRKPGSDILLADILMSGFALFNLKDPSLLAFDQRREECNPNLKTLYGIERAPCDTWMREVLDRIPYDQLRSPFRVLFHHVQRGKALEQMVFMDGYHLLSVDASGYFSSNKLSSPLCLEKTNASTGLTTHSLQMLGAVIVHPDFEQVIPLAPEFIMNQDGHDKNDCERNAAKRFIPKLREDHPHLKLIVVEDGLFSNAPHIRDLKANHLSFILGVKPGDHTFLFDTVDEASRKKQTTEWVLEDPTDPKKAHFFRFLNGVALNESNPDVVVNFLEYWQSIDGEDEPLHFSWVTDLTITRDNTFQLTRAGRCRWKVENETFNTIKNQGYHLEHNFGLGEQYASMNFVMLMMLAFLVDQILQLCCHLFRSVWRRLGSKRALWDKFRAIVECFALQSMEELYRALLQGYKRQAPEPIDSS